MTQPMYEITKEGQLVFHPHKGQLQAWDSTARFVAVIAGTQSGKALALDTPIPTSKGIIPLSEVRIGDTVFTEFGQPQTVKYLSDVYEDRPCYRVVFDEGSSIVADAGHWWVTQTIQERKHHKHGRKRTTDELRTTLRKHGKNNHAIPVSSPWVFPEKELPIPPYTLGCWLGDGFSSSAILVTMDEEILDYVRQEGINVGKARECGAGQARCYRIGGTEKRGGNDRGSDSLQAALRRENLLGNKHIPSEYFTASFSQRLALLQGILDTDGYYGGYVELVSAREDFARQVCRLAQTLGIKARVSGVERKWRVTFSTELPVFRLRRKRVLLPAVVRNDAKRRYVVSVDPVPSVPVRCVGVSGVSSLFLCGEAGIPTHNTSFGPFWFHREMHRCGPGDYLIAAPTYPLLDLKLIPEFKRLFVDMLGLGTWQGSPVPKFYVSEQGARKLWGYVPDVQSIVHFGYAANPDSLESMTVKAAWLDEPGQRLFKLASFEAILRRLSLSMGRVLLTTTPYYVTSWVKKLLFDRQNDPMASVSVANFRSIDNPAFPRAEYERAQRDLPPWKFDMMYNGLFTRPAGIIYDSFNPELHVIPRIALPERWPRYWGLDFGPVNTVGLFAAMEPGSGNLYVYREYKAGGRTAKEHVDSMKATEPGMPVAVYGGAKSEDNYRLEYRAAGLPVKEPKISDVEIGISRVYAEHRNNRLFVFDDLTQYLEQKESYSRPLDEMGEPIDGIEDKEKFHFMDAERYLIGSVRSVETSGYVQRDPSGYDTIGQRSVTQHEEWYGR